MNLLVGRPVFTLASADTEFGRRVLTLAGSSALPHFNGVDIIYVPQEYSFPLAEEQNSNPDAFLCSDT